MVKPEGIEPPPFPDIPGALPLSYGLCELFERGTRTPQSGARQPVLRKQPGHEAIIKRRACYARILAK